MPSYQGKSSQPRHVTRRHIHKPVLHPCQPLKTENIKVESVSLNVSSAKSLRAGLVQPAHLTEEKTKVLLENKRCGSRQKSLESQMSRSLSSCLILPLSLNLSQKDSSLPTSYLPTSSAQGQATGAQSSLALCWHFSKVSLVSHLQAQPTAGGVARSLTRMLCPCL